MAHGRRWLEGWGELDPGVCWEQQGELGAAAWARSVEPVIARSAAGEPFLLLEALIATGRDVGEPSLCLAVSERARLPL